MKQKKRFGEFVSPWIVKLAKETGFEIEGYKHKITEDFERHVLKQHGNRNKVLNAKTFWIVRKTVNTERIKEILKNTKGYDISKIKIATATDANSALYSAQSAEGGGNLHRHGSQRAKKSECYSL